MGEGGVLGYGAKRGDWERNFEKKELIDFKTLACLNISVFLQLCGA